MRRIVLWLLLTLPGRAQYPPDYSLVNATLPEPQLMVGGEIRDFRPGESRIAVQIGDELRVCQADGKTLRTFRQAAGPGHWDFDGRRIARVEGGQLQLLDGDSGSLLWSGPCPGSDRVILEKDAIFVARSTTLWRLGPGLQPTSWALTRHPAEPKRMAWHLQTACHTPNRLRYLLTGGRNSTILAEIELDTGKRKEEEPEHEAAISCRWSQDGTVCGKVSTVPPADGCTTIGPIGQQPPWYLVYWPADLQALAACQRWGVYYVAGHYEIVDRPARRIYLVSGPMPRAAAFLGERLLVQTAQGLMSWDLSGLR